jgi:RNA polymerase sigma-70 factor, ECF subfamily
MTGPERAGSGSRSDAERREAVFESAFLAHYGRIAGLLWRLLGDRAQAEELAADVFLKLYRQPWLAASDGKVSGWLYRAATNLGIDALRARASHHQHEEALGRANRAAPPAPDPLQEVLRAERQRSVRAVLARLKPERARILILRAAGFSYNELAEVLDVKRTSVGVMLARAEAEFQQRFLRMFGKEEQS